MTAAPAGRAVARLRRHFLRPPTHTRVRPLPLPELVELEGLIAEAPAGVRARVACEVRAGAQRFPVHVLSLGSDDPSAPAVGFFGGVHGLERIGAEVVLAYLKSLLRRLAWDAVLRQQLQSLRLVFMPLVNPAGLWLGTRANASGVDLMRNSPVEAGEPVPLMIGGQRLSPRLPWYRGAEGAPMELESAALCDLVEQELLSRPFSLAIDCHSGFGARDRIWFPHAHTVEPIEHLPELHALYRIFEQSHVHHQYVFEPQSLQYRTHGDLWDHLYLRALQGVPKVFLPLTLEMGSWLWIKKNPRQLFNRYGIFNPLIAHRQQRVMRRHLSLLDFFTRAASGHAQWLPATDQREGLRRQARQRWYGALPP